MDSRVDPKTSNVAPSSSGPPRGRQLVAWIGFVGLLFYVGYRGNASHSGERAPHELNDRLQFREVANELGIQFQHTAPTIHDSVANIAAQITAVGAAVSIVDANSDGRPDIYAVSSGHEHANALYINRGDGHFDDVAREAGLADLNRNGEGCSMGSVWADIDNDGDEDVLVYAWGQSRLFLSVGELRFEEATHGSGLEGWMNSNAATFFDFDRDGNLDLFLTGYFPAELDLWNLETTSIMHDSFEYSHNGGANRLFRGRGDGTFSDVTKEMLPEDHRWTYAVVAADFDRDGWQDLYIANDYGEEELLLNRKGERFEFAENIGVDGESKSGMCAALGDVSGDGRLCVYVTNISKRGYLFQGNNLRAAYLEKGGKMLQMARGPAVDCGWAWGAQFGDFDNDGHQDLVVTNGFISASKERDYWYQMSKLGLATGDVIADAAKWPAFEDRSLSGYERTRVLHNLGLRGAHFREVGLEVGVDDTYDGRGVAVADLFGTGRLDVVIANQNGPLLVYRNESQAGAHWITFDLVGSVSNRSALGAEVLLEVAGRKQIRVVTAACGFASQNDHRLHFGLGSEEVPPRVDALIRWPSGLEERKTGLEIDRVHRIEEPK